MLIIPAIDLMDGKCVRLFKGNFKSVKVYGDNPVEMAAKFVEAGAKWIHVVDLDAARGSSKGNRAAAANIKLETGCKVELGGGIRSESDVEEALELGIDRLVLGTVLARDPEVVAGWVKRYGPVFVAGIDAMNGRVRVSGWEEEGGIEDVELARRVRDIGIDRIIYTNISRDGVLSGPDVESTNRIADESGAKVVLSGGVGKDSDIEEVYKVRKRNIVGVIVGKAIYENKVDLKRAISLYQKGSEW